MTTPTGIRSYFDARADEYLAGRDRQHSFVAQRDLVLGMLEGVRGRVADIGCGPAVMAPHLLQRGLEVWAIDASPRMIDRGHARLAGHPRRGRAHLHVGDITSLRLADGFCDAVIAMGVLEYLPDYAPALREIHRVLRPGGVAVLTVPNRASQYHVFHALLRSPRRAARRDGFVTNRCLPWRLDRQLAAAGLQKTQGRTCNFMLFPLPELHPGWSLALNRRLSTMPWVPRWLGCQYVVKAQKRDRGQLPNSRIR
jgi:SAM-dependent methyltransferase